MGVVISVFGAILDTLSAIFTGFIKSRRPEGWGYWRHVMYTALRAGTRVAGMTFAKYYRTMSSAGMYGRFARMKRLPRELVDIGEGASGGWFGKKDASKILLYFHGGGYIIPPAHGHFGVIADLVKYTKTHDGKDLGAFFLAYGIAPKFQYPVQLKQAVAALKYLVEVVGRNPQDIIIAGDSAGGNLCAALLSHLSHPHPDVPNVDLGEGKKLGGVFFISPWVTFGDDTPSMKSNSDKDFLFPGDLRHIANQYMGDSGDDNYTVPLMAPADWWQGLLVEDICVDAGEYEIFLDDIRAFAANLKVYNPQTELYVAPQETHVQPVTDRTMFNRKRAKSELKLREWFSAML